MRTFTVTTNLIVGLLSVAGAWGAETPQAQKQAPGAPSPPTQVPQIPQGAPLLKHFGVGTPVVGSNNTLGLVQLVRVAGPPGVNIKLTSSHPTIVKVPDTVIVMRGLSDQSFQVGTGAVAAPTSVTVSAQVAGGETKTVTVIVQPPKLSVFACNPGSIPVGIQTTCTAWLDGEAPADASVTTSAPDYGFPIFPYVNIPKGQRAGSRQLIGQNSGPQPRAVTVNASFGGVSKSTPLTVGPAYLKNISFVRGTFFAPSAPYHLLFRADLYAPAPSGGLPYKVQMEPELFREPSTKREVPAGQSSEEFWVFLKPVAADTDVRIFVTTNVHGANDTKSATATVKAARLNYLYAYWRCNPSCDYLGGVGPAAGTFSPAKEVIKEVILENVPLGGVPVKIEAYLQGHAPASGATLALSYSSSLVTGPPTVRISANDWDEDFRVTVHPCPQAECPGWIRATYLGQTVVLPLKVRRT